MSLPGISRIMDPRSMSLSTTARLSSLNACVLDYGAPRAFGVVSSHLKGRTAMSYKFGISILGGKYLSRRGEGGERWLGGPLRSPAVTLKDVDPKIVLISSPTVSI